jgi:hypothetical protein
VIPTVATLRTRNRRIDRKLATAQLVLAEMRNGAALHLTHARGGPIWALSTGKQITDHVARLVIASSNVVGVGDALFAGCRAQTYRWWSEESGV